MSNINSIPYNEFLSQINKVEINNLKGKTSYMIELVQQVNILFDKLLALMVKGEPEYASPKDRANIFTKHLELKALYKKWISASFGLDCEETVKYQYNVGELLELSTPIPNVNEIIRFVLPRPTWKERERRDFVDDIKGTSFYMLNEDVDIVYRHFVFDLIEVNETLNCVMFRAIGYQRLPISKKD